MAHNVKFPSKQDDKDALKGELDDLGLSSNDAEQDLLKAADTARNMARKALRYTDFIFDKKKKHWKNGFNGDQRMVDWFGKVKSKGKAKNVRNRLQKLFNRIDRGVTMKLRPNKNSSTNASNHGGLFSPRGMKIYPNFFENNANTDARASIILHELMHVWFTDKKINGNKLKTAKQAKDLAKESSGKARRSPENYERFCLDIWQNT